MRRKIKAFTDDPWKDVDMPEGFDPEKNEFLNPKLRGKDPIRRRRPKTSAENGAIMMGIDPRLMDDGATKTQDEWIEYFKTYRTGRGEERFLPSMPDFYLELKLIADKLPATEFARGTLLDLTKEKLILSGTRIVYQENSLEAEIIHYYGTSEPESRELVIPDYDGRPQAGEFINTARVDEQFVAYMQTLFGTEDDINTILSTLGACFGVEPGKVELWTPSQERRKDEEFKHCAAMFPYKGINKVTLNTFSAKEEFYALPMAPED